MTYIYSHMISGISELDGFIIRLIPHQPNADAKPRLEGLDDGPTTRTCGTCSYFSQWSTGNPIVKHMNSHHPSSFQTAPNSFCLMDVNMSISCGETTGNPSWIEVFT